MIAQDNLSCTPARTHAHFSFVSFLTPTSLSRTLFSLLSPPRPPLPCPLIPLFLPLLPPRQLRCTLFPISKRQRLGMVAGRKWQGVQASARAEANPRWRKGRQQWRLQHKTDRIGVVWHSEWSLFNKYIVEVYIKTTRIKTRTQTRKLAHPIIVC